VAHTIQPSLALLIVRTILWWKMGSTLNELECPDAGTPASGLGAGRVLAMYHQIRCYLRSGVTIGLFKAIFRLRGYLLSCKSDIKHS
jgi:hypothetical protein